MPHVGDVVLYRDTIDDLLADEQHRDEDKGQRDLAFSERGEGREQDEGEHHTAGAAQRHTGEENIVDKPGDQRRDEDDAHKLFGAVFFFQQGTEQ